MPRDNYEQIRLGELEQTHQEHQEQLEIKSAAVSQAESNLVEKRAAFSSAAASNDRARLQLARDERDEAEVKLENAKHELELARDAARGDEAEIAKARTAIAAAELAERKASLRRAGSIPKLHTALALLWPKLLKSINDARDTLAAMKAACDASVEASKALRELGEVETDAHGFHVLHWLAEMCPTKCRALLRLFEGGVGDGPFVHRLQGKAGPAITLEQVLTLLAIVDAAPESDDPRAREELEVIFSSRAFTEATAARKELGKQREAAARAARPPVVPRPQPRAGARVELSIPEMFSRALGR